MPCAPGPGRVRHPGERRRALPEPPTAGNPFGRMWSWQHGRAPRRTVRSRGAGHAGGGEMDRDAAARWEETLIADLREHDGRPSAGPLAGQTLMVMYSTGARSGE